MWTSVMLHCRKCGHGFPQSTDREDYGLCCPCAVDVGFKALTSQVGIPIDHDFAATTANLVAGTAALAERTVDVVRSWQEAARKAWEKATKSV